MQRNTVPANSSPSKACCLTSSPSTRPRFTLNFRPQRVPIGLKNSPLPTLPSSWLPSGTRLFDFSPDSDRPTTSPTSRSWEPLEHQRMPDGEWDCWLILAGRGTGKTRAGAEAVLAHLNDAGSFARVGVGGPTAADVRDVCAEGVSGLITVAREQFVSYNRSLGEAHHHKGGYVKFLGAEEPARWNGPQWSLLWADELALWNQDSWEQAQFGLRLGDRPRAIATTTPKSRQFVRTLAEQSTTHVTYASTAQNPYLSELVRQRLYDRYGGTRLGRQELDAEWLDDVPGALWQRSQIDATRIKQAPDMARVVVAIDPAVTSGEDSDETGIVVAGRGVDGRGYVLADRSCRLTPDGWARRAAAAYAQFS